MLVSGRLPFFCHLYFPRANWKIDAMEILEILRLTTPEGVVRRTEKCS